MIGVFAHHDRAEQAGTGQAFLDRFARRWCNGHMLLACSASILEAHMLDHLQQSGLKLQLLAFLRTNPLALLAAIGTELFLIVQIVFDNFARQMVGQRLASATSAAVFADDDRTIVRFIGHLGIAVCLVHVVVIEQLQLIRIEALAAWAVLVAKQLLHVVFQLLNPLVGFANRL